MVQGEIGKKRKTIEDVDSCADFKVTLVIWEISDI